MTEILVEQRTTEWQQLRQSVCLTASCFADALGIGRGKPYDFLQSLIEPDGEDAEPTACIKHGVLMEPVINDAYQLLTGNRTQPGGFWINEDGPLHHLIGASPDAKVFSRKSNEMIGLAEFKAPVHRMHGSSHACKSPDLRQAIPRAHLAQIQGQMAVCKADWCDYMSLCRATREITLLRVYFEPDFWKHISSLIENFCHIVKVLYYSIFDI
jgi:YqaJ-like viral recombinase domain